MVIDVRLLVIDCLTVLQSSSIFLFAFEVLTWKHILAVKILFKTEQ